MNDAARASALDVCIDAHLIRNIVNGDKASLDELHRRYAPAVFARAYRVCRDESLADESTQDVFVQAWRGASTYDATRGSVRSWLLVIARTRTLDRVRARQTRDGRLAPVEDADRSGAPRHEVSPELSAGTSEHAALIETLLAILPPDDRRLIDLAFFKGLTHHEISTSLEQPLGTVKTRLRRVLRLLRAAISVQARPPFLWNGWGADRVSALPRPGALQNLHVLVVDDDPDTVKLLTLVLERAGALVVPATSAAQALKRIGAVWPDLLVTDLEMPDEDGYELLKRVRSLPCGRGGHLPAVAFTAHGHDRDKDRTERAGFALHLPKPVRPSTLVSRVAELLAGGARNDPESRAS